MEKFLGDLAASQEEEAVKNFLQRMKAHIREDQGSITAINKAVRAVGAAILYHNVLIMDAYALARGKRSPSK